MKCPMCDSDDHYVTESRPTPEGIRRRRHCAKCNERFSTLELVAEMRPGRRKSENKAPPKPRQRQLGLPKPPLPAPVQRSVARRKLEELKDLKDLLGDDDGFDYA